MTVEKGLPTNVDAERLVLGSVLLDNSCFDDVAVLENDFALETHGRIFKRMRDLRERDERIDRVTVFQRAQQARRGRGMRRTQLPRQPR
jgi:replicative DNA helicase